MERAPTGEFPVDRIIPEQFGDYQRLDEGHSGGMGTVYRVLNRKLNVERALKVLKQGLTMHPAAREAFVREAHFGAQLAGGPHILPVHTVGTLEGWYFFEMDWVDGPNLHHFVQKKGQLHPWAAMIIGAMVCDALNFAHHARIRQESGNFLEGLIHRDIKPANILLEPNTGRMMLTDFGIARARDAARASRDAYTAGTINYLTPEQIRAQPVDERSDIYQVGLVLYEILAGGRKAFPGEEDSGVTGRIIDGTYESLDRHVKKLDPQVMQIIRRAMDRNPAKRYQSAKEMRDDIRKYMKLKYAEFELQPAFKKYLQTGKVPSEKKFLSDPKHKKVVKLGIGAAVVAVLAVAAFLFLPKFLVGRAHDQWEQTYNAYRDVRAEWGRQPWTNSRVESVDAQENSFSNPSHDTKEYDRAKALALALTDQLSTSLDSVRTLSQDAVGEFERMRNAFALNEPPTEALEQAAKSQQEIGDLVALDHYIEAEQLARERVVPLKEFLARKQSEFDTQVESLQRAIDNKRGRFQSDPQALAAVEALGRAVTTRAAVYRTQFTFADGKTWLDETRDSLNGIGTSGGGSSTSAGGGSSSSSSSYSTRSSDCPGVSGQISNSEDALGAFTSEKNWQSFQSSLLVPVDVPLLQDYLREAKSMAQRGDCSDAEGRAVSIVQGVAQLYGEWASVVVDSLASCEPSRGVANPHAAGFRSRLAGMSPYDQQNWRDLQDIMLVARGEFEACLGGAPPEPVDYYEDGIAAWDNHRCAEAERLLNHVPKKHINYLFSRMILAHARACQNKYDDLTLRLYKEAGPIPAGNLLAMTNLLQCYYWVGMCDSVDSYYDHARALGHWSCNENESEYRTALYYRIKCDLQRFAQARDTLHLGEEFWLKFGRSGVSKCDEFERCFPNSDLLEDVRAMHDIFRR